MYVRMSEWDVWCVCGEGSRAGCRCNKQEGDRCLCVVEDYYSGSRECWSAGLCEVGRRGVCERIEEE